MIWTARSGDDRFTATTGTIRAGASPRSPSSWPCDVLVPSRPSGRPARRRAAVIRDHRSCGKVGRRGPRRFSIRHRGRRQPRTGVAPEAAQRRRLRGRLDADRAARVPELAKTTTASPAAPRSKRPSRPGSLQKPTRIAAHSSRVPGSSTGHASKSGPVLEDAHVLMGAGAVVAKQWQSQTGRPDTAGSFRAS